MPPRSAAPATRPLFPSIPFRLKCPLCRRPMDPQQTLDDSALWTCRKCRISLCIEDFSDLTNKSYKDAWDQWYPDASRSGP